MRSAGSNAPISLLLLLPFAALVGCAAAPTTPRDGAVSGRQDGGVSGPDATIAQPECASNEECPHGFVCAAVMSQPRCVPDPDPPPPGDGSDCSPCPAPGECRAGACIQPSSSGAFCEFDDVCSDTELCIAGRCTHDPRVPVACTDDSMCPLGLSCGPDGTCICTYTTDCPIGLVCLDSGLCGPGPGGDPCIADAECPAESVCDAGRCRPATVCDIAHPDLAGTWDVQSVLHIREALPSWLESFLATVAEPFRFLSGDATCIDFGLPTWVETEICDLVRPFVDQHLPPWSFSVFRAIADLNDVLSEWHIEERMELTAGDVADSYRGTHEWLSITMMHRGVPIEGTPDTILDWRFSPSPFNASAVCGSFHIERHDVNVSIGSIIAWAIDTIVYEASDHRWASVSAALTELATGFCDALADAADSAIDYDVRGTVSSVCQSALGDLIDTAVREILESRIGASPLTLRGHGAVGSDSLGRPHGPTMTPPGQWNGTLLGREFPGTFCAVRDGLPLCGIGP